MSTDVKPNSSRRHESEHFTKKASDALNGDDSDTQRGIGYALLALNETLKNIEATRGENATPHEVSVENVSETVADDFSPSGVWWR